MGLLVIIRYNLDNSSFGIRFVFYFHFLFIDNDKFPSHLFYSFGSLYFAMQHVKPHWCFHWEGSLMEKNVYSLLMIGMPA